MKASLFIQCRALALSFAAFMAGCGGGGQSAPRPEFAVRMTVQEGAAQQPGANASINFPTGLDPAASVAWQAAAPGQVIVAMEPFRDTVFARLDEYLAEAAKYRNVRWIYVFDELFWSGPRETGGVIEIGADEAPVTAAARRVQRAGFQSVITLMPNVVLHPAFTLADPNAFSVITLDLYPSLLIDRETHGCKYDANPFTTILACSIAKLRATGFTGEIWYVYQAFGDTRDANLVPELQLQRQTIAAAPALGVTGLVGFGSAPAIGLELPLYAGRGTPIEQLVGLTDTNR